MIKIETKAEIIAFIRESNKIEGIVREPNKEEIAEYRRFIALPSIAVADMIQFVSVYQPNARLRMQSWQTVTIGNHTPRPGGQGVLYELDDILANANDEAPPYVTHMRYERLHPFMDGNGRSGRMLWRWMMGTNYIPFRGFLHDWYYQSLENWRNE